MRPGAHPWISRLFPPGSLRRLLAKLLLWLIRRPLALLSQFRFSRVSACLRYLWQREYALIEDRVAYALGQPGTRHSNRVSTETRDVTALFAGTLIRLAVHVTPETLTDLPKTLTALAQQTYPNWELVLVYAPGLERDRLTTLTYPLPTNHRTEIIPVSELARLWQSGDYIGLLQAGDTLTSQALTKLVLPVMGALPDLIYCDEMDITRPAGAQPFFKPDWSPRLLLGMNYIGGFFLVKRERLTGIDLGPYGCSPEGVYDLLLKCTDHPQVVRHVPAVLYQPFGKRIWQQDRGRKVLADTLARRNITGEIIPLQLPGTFRARRHLADQPLVSILLLTALRRRGLLKRCLTSLQRRTTYRNVQIILVDNSPGGRADREIPKGLQITRVPYPEVFNYSRMNNLAATQAGGDYLIFLNDDTEILTPDWIETLLEQAQVPQTGVVGCQLVYPRGMIQHAGMFLVRQGTGARHAFRYLRRLENSYHGFGSVVRECSAVTFACAMVPRTVFSSLGGLDESLRVECNDLDFCLRAGQQGYSTIYTPFARVRHAELVSRRRTHVSEDIEAFKKRWQWLMDAGDPFYNPNLSEDSDLYRPGAQAGAQLPPRQLYGPAAKSTQE